MQTETKKTAAALASIALTLNLTPSEATIAPTALDRFAVIAGWSSPKMLTELKANPDLRDYFRDVCREVAATSEGREVIREMDGASR